MRKYLLERIDIKAVEKFLDAQNTKVNEIVQKAPERVNEMEQERLERKLSDAFEEPDETKGYEWTAVMININAGRNTEIMTRCRDLYDYSELIGRIKEYSKVYELLEAVDQAVKECIQEGILRILL